MGRNPTWPTRLEMTTFNLISFILDEMIVKESSGSKMKAILVFTMGLYSINSNYIYAKYIAKE